MPETVYYGSRPVISLGAAELQTSSATDSTADVPGKGVMKEAAMSRDAEAVEDTVPPKSYLESLKPFSKSAINPDVTYYKAFLRPFVLVA
jgi:hypothetical protein